MASHRGLPVDATLTVADLTVYLDRIRRAGLAPETPVRLDVDRLVTSPMGATRHVLPAVTRRVRRGGALRVRATG